MAFLVPKRAALSLLALGALGFAVEMTGVATGFSYGTFNCGDSLGPKVADLDPYLLSLSWAPLILGVVAATAAKGKAASRRRELFWSLSAGVCLPS